MLLLGNSASSAERRFFDTAPSLLEAVFAVFFIIHILPNKLLVPSQHDKQYPFPGTALSIFLADS